MRKLMVLAAMLAMMIVASAPAMADERNKHDRNDRDHDGAVFTSGISGDSDLDDVFDGDDFDGTFLVSDGDIDEEDFFDEIDVDEEDFFDEIDIDDFDFDEDESFVILDSEGSDFDEFEFEEVFFV